ncbi:hypothetical protein MMC17_010107 [Xylographa soralifera]|nr:hypothetical protein [Xylographa soralifera]
MSFAGYDLMGDLLRAQSERIHTSYEADEADVNTEDMYLAPSPTRNSSEPPMAGDSHRTRSMTPLFMEPGEAHNTHNTNVVEYASGNMDRVSAENPEAKIEEQLAEIEIVDIVNIAKLDNRGPQNLVLPIDEVKIKEEDNFDLEWTWKNASTEAIVLIPDEHDASSQPEMQMPIDEVNIKEEIYPPFEWTWKNAPTDVVFISDDEHDTSSQPGLQIPIDEVNIKEEVDPPFEWTWKNTPADVVFITDDEDDASSRLGVQTHDASTAFAPVTTSISVPHKKALLLKRKQRHRPTPAEILRMEEIQKIMAERATGRPLIGGVGSLFKGVHAVHESVAAHTLLESGDNEWMNLEVSDSDEDKAKAFRRIKKNYNLRKNINENTEEDDVLFIRAAKAEKLRLSRVEKEQAQQKNQDEADTIAFVSSQDEELLNGAGLDEASSLKRPFEATSERILEVSNPGKADFSRRNASSWPIKRQRQRYKDSEVIRRDPVTKAEGSAIGPAKPRKGKKPKAKHTEDSSQPLKVKETKKSTAYQEPSMTNIASLVGRDVIADAQANADKGEQPTFRDHRKRQALNELVASLPGETRRIHHTDKKALLKATQSFNGRGAMKADGKGGWKLKGMKTSLYHYQLLGAAFMRNRENGQNEPLGGILADEMGFGCCRWNQNDFDYNNSGSCGSMDERDPTPRHTEENVINDVIQYDSSLRRIFSDVATSLQKSDCVVTTFSQVQKSFPRRNPPKELESDEAKEEWWVKHREKYKGPLHRIMWHRIVIDEAQYIKNHNCQTAIACCGLEAKHRWLLSGTPIQNDITEFFSYFTWLKVNHIGSFEDFKKNFCAKGNNAALTRLHSFLNSFMCRRTHMNTIFGVPILKLPASEQRTTLVDFTELERSIYDIVKCRFQERIRGLYAQGNLEKNYRHVFTLLLRLRQMTGHILIIQETIEDLLEDVDIEKLEVLTTKEQNHSVDRSIILQLRKILASSKRCASSFAKTNSTPGFDSTTHSPEDLDTGGSFGVTSVNFQKYLRTLHEDSKSSDRNGQTSCCKCRQPAKDLWITSCQHIFCRVCLVDQHREASLAGEENTICCECREVYTSSTRWIGSDSNPSSPSDKPGKRRRPSKDEEDPLKWIEMDGQLLPSAKTTAVKAQIVNWKKEAPGEKIIIFTLFHDMIRILSRIFDQEKWGYCQYHGKMTHTARDAAISSFKKEKNRGILIASLKCGGVGLNLVMASKVFNVDLWWNSAVEQQAFCRIFRIGQKLETNFQRVVVRDTIDEKLLAMQKRKDQIIKRALGDDGKNSRRFSVAELLNLFGEVDLDV